MGTNLTFRGQDVDLVLEDSTIKLTPTAGTGDTVVIPRSEIAAVDLTPATLLGYGRLVISTRAGAQHTVQFPRDANEHFGNLEAIIRP